MEGKKKRLNLKQRQHRLNNLQCDLEVTLMALLSPYCSFVVARPQKKAVVTRQFVKIKEIILNNGDKVCLSKLVKTRGKEFVEEKVKGGVSRKTAVRRMHSSRRFETQHILEDILLEFGVMVLIEKEETAGVDGIIRIIGPNFELRNKQITQIALNVNSQVFQFGNDKDLTLTPNTLTPYVC